MKPNFALNLTHDAIVLLHRAARGWMAIGEVALDSDDLTEALGYLRSSAMGISPQGMTTKLVLPNSQILYTEVEAPGPDVAARHRQVKAALEGLTPYPVDDLVYDIWGQGSRVQVAVVARDTLQEAEAFAAQHRFNPVSFVAIPPGGSFGGEPFFGPTEMAAVLLAAGEAVVRDQDPVSIVTRDGSREDGNPRNGAARADTKTAEDPAPAKASLTLTSPKVAPAKGSAMPEPLVPDTAVSEKPQLAATALPTSAAKQTEAPPPAPPPEVKNARTVPAEPLPVAVALAAPDLAEPQANAPAAAMIPPPEPANGPDHRDKAAQPMPVQSALAEPAKTVPVELPPAGMAPLAHGAANVAMAGDVPPGKSAVSPLPPATPALSAPPATEPAPLDATASATAPEAPPLAPRAEPAPSPAFASRRRGDARTAAFDRAEEPLPPAHQALPPLVARRSVPNGPQTEPPLGPPFVRAAPPPTPIAAPSPAREPGGMSAISAKLPPMTAEAAVTTTKAPPPPRIVQAATPDVPPPAPKTARPPAPGTPAHANGTTSAVVPVATMVPPLAAARPAAVAERPTKPNAGTSSAAPNLRANAGADIAPAAPAKRPGKPQAADGSLRPGAAGAVAGRNLRQRGKPRFLGLALTGLLLIFLAVIAAWSSLYLSKNDAPPATDTQVATIATNGSEGQLQPEAPAPVIVSAGEAVEPDPVLLTDLAAAGRAPLPVPETATAAVEPVPVPPAPETPSVPPALVTDGSDVTMSTSAATTGQDEILLSAVDAPPPAFDAVTLPKPVADPDTTPVATAPPPPFGSTYQFDENGRIIAGPTGVVAPGNFWLIAARPPITPPPRPALATIAPPTAALAPEATVTVVPEAATEGVFVPDPTFANSRPRSRPDNLVPPAPKDPAAAEPVTDPAATTDHAAGDGAALPKDDPRYVAMRPKPRSATAVARGQDTTANALAAASLVASAEATAAAAPRDPDTSPLAVPLSRRPAARPKDFSSAVAAAVAAATQPPLAAQPAPEPDPAPDANASAAAVAPEAQPEPEVVASAAPRIPTHANVARQATFANAINLSKVNLIGIYGTPSNRYAMVRTSGGRFTRVKVGDRVDGGTVAAITSTEVRYKKGGRTLTLAMPRG